MTEKSQCMYWTSLVLVAFGLGLVGCGDDESGDGKGAGGSGGGGGGGGGSAVGSAVCNTECEMQGAEGCLVVGSVEECKDVCGDLKRFLPAACYEAMEAISQCRVANDDACGSADPDPCAAELDADLAACGM